MRHRWNPEARKFAKDETIVKIEKRPFTCGAMRHCFRVSRSAPGEASFRANSDARWRRLARAHAPLLPGKSERAGGSPVSCELRCPLAASRPSSVATNFDRAGGAWPRRTGPKCVRVRGPSRMKIPARSVGRTAGRSLPRPGRPARHLPSVETDTLPPRKSRMRKGFPSTRGCLFLETVPRETSPTEYGGRTPTEDATAA